MTDPIKFKFMTEVTYYPGGQTYVKSFPIGEAKIVNNESMKKKQEKIEVEMQKKIKDSVAKSNDDEVF